MTTRIIAQAVSLAPFILIFGCITFMGANSNNTKHQRHTGTSPFAIAKDIASR